jgi:glutathione S-transferase
MAPGKHFLFSMQLSWYSAKVRPYLRFKGIPFDERIPTAWEYYVTIRRHVGHAVVPVVITPDGEWLQDSSIIIERLEQAYPAPPVVPATPRQRLAAYLLELWADEFWLSAAVHARWSFPENYAKWRDELASAFAPGWPVFLQRLLPLGLRKFMLDANRQLGATPEQRPAIERWMARHLDHLERHFATLPYLFGSRPSLGDFAIAGPICGHLRYDESARRRLLVPRPNLLAWSDRMASERSFPPGDFLADDGIPPTLLPMLESVFGEMVPMLAATAGQVRSLGHRPGGHLPRMTGLVQFPLAGETFSREGLPYALWMAQRVLDVLAAMSPADAATARHWMQSLGGRAFLDLDIPRLERVGVHAALATQVVARQTSLAA